MPAIRLTDAFSLSIDFEPDPLSTFAKYFKIPEIAILGFNISQLADSTLADPSLTELQARLAFRHPVDLGTTPAGLKIEGDVTGTLSLFVPRPRRHSLFAGDDFSDPIYVPLNQRYVGVGITLSTGAQADARAGGIAAGFQPGAEVEAVYYRRFSVDPAPPPVVSAITTTLGSFSVPANLADVLALPEQSVVTLSGKGTLRFSGIADLLGIVNPLVTVPLPLEAASIHVRHEASIQVAVRYGLTGRYQIRIHKVGPKRVRLGCYRERDSQLTLKASAGAGLSATGGGHDLYDTVIRAIGADAAADRKELRAAGVPSRRVDEIEDAVRAGLERKLELAAEFELERDSSERAVFLYDIDMARLDPAGEQAFCAALRGDLSALIESEASPLPGIQMVRSLFTAIRRQKHVFRVNLLGIYNYVSISKLALNGTVLYEPSTGDLVVTDTVTAARIRASMSHAGSDSAKLRHVLAEAFLVTAAYRGTGLVAAAPLLRTSHSFFKLNHSTDLEEMRESLDVAAGLELLSLGEQEDLLGGTQHFGRSATYAATEYDEALTADLFLEGGEPRPIEEYETIGRRALQLVIRPGDEDDYRLPPCLDDGLWSQMKARGQADLVSLFPRLSRTQVTTLRADYSLVVWWSRAMHETGSRLAILKSEANRGSASVHSVDKTQALRRDLAEHLRSVAAATREEFGQPWGLIAMDLASGRRARAKVQVSSARLAIVRERRIPGAV